MIFSGQLWIDANPAKELRPIVDYQDNINDFQEQYDETVKEMLK